MKKTVLFLLLCLAAAPGLSQTLTLDECRAAAEEHNRTLKTSRLDLDAALQARRRHLPPISAGLGLGRRIPGPARAGAGRFRDPADGSLPLSLVKRGILGSVTAVQPLFAGLKIVSGNKLARLGEEVAQLQLQKTAAEVRERTDTYFWQVVSLRDNLSTIEAVERQLAEIHRQVALSIKAGLVTTNDLLRVELRRQEVASNRLKVENGLKVSKMLLAQHIGADWHTFDIAASDFGEPEAPAAYYVPVDEALDRRAEYLLSEKNVEAQKYRKRMERGKRLPTVAVGAGYLYYNVTDKDVDDGMVFAQVSIPISDWWGGAHALKKARIDEMQAENDRQEAREMLAVEIERTWSEVQEAHAQILLMQRSVASSTENLRQNRNFYDAGTATLTDLLDAETLYTQSRNNLTSAYAAYHTSLAKYMRVTGR
ncbi:MAG: TolC family protein [Alistipes onderdonkii]